MNSNRIKIQGHVIEIPKSHAMFDIPQWVFTLMQNGFGASFPLSIWNRIKKRRLYEQQMKRILTIYVNTQWFEFRKRKRLIKMYHITYIQWKK